MSIPPAKSLVVDLGSGRFAVEALHCLGQKCVGVEGQLADACTGDPETFRDRLGWQPPRGALLVVAFGGNPPSPASACNWDEELHLPLTRCFTFVRALGPPVRQAGGHVIVLLPATALLFDPARGAASTLHRAALGFFEALRAEESEGPLRVSIAVLDEKEDAVAFAHRLGALIKEGRMYSLPAMISEEMLRSHFAPLVNAAANTPRAPDFPQPPTPMGEVYAREIEPHPPA